LELMWACYLAKPLEILMAWRWESELVFYLGWTLGSDLVMQSASPTV
jgi:hypothetical protein